MHVMHARSARLLPFPPSRIVSVVVVLLLAGTIVAADADLAEPADPFAGTVVSYDAGSNAVPGYTDPSVALGAPERFTGEGFEPAVVSILNPAWRPDEIVSIGGGGQLTLRFATPVTDDPDNPFGVDLLVFGNAFFVESAAVPGAIGVPAVCSCEGGVVEVSADGETWVLVPDIDADGLYPTEGYLDGDDPHATSPGTVPSDFTRPVNPAITLADFDGLSYAQVLELYRGSGGGAGIDLAPLGLSSISYVRVSAPPGGPSIEIDAVADVRARRPGDVNADGLVDFADLLALLAAWGPARPRGWDADFDGDGVVGFADLLVLLTNWGGA